MSFGKRSSTNTIDDGSVYTPHHGEYMPKKGKNSHFFEGLWNKKAFLCAWWATWIFIASLIYGSAMDYFYPGGHPPANATSIIPLGLGALLYLLAIIFALISLRKDTGWYGSSIIIVQPLIWVCTFFLLSLIIG